MAPTHLVARASLASRVLALLRDRKESATPPMAPGEAGALAGLEEHDDNDCQTAEKLQDRDDER